MNFNDILNSQINEAIDLKQDQKCFDLLIKSAPKLLKVLEFGKAIHNFKLLQSQLNTITSQEVIPFLQKVDYQFSDYYKDIIESLTKSNTNNFIAFFNKDKINNTNPIESIKKEVNNASQINLASTIQICKSIIGLNKLFTFIGKSYTDIKNVTDLINFYRPRTDIEIISATKQKYTVKINNDKLYFYVDGKCVIDVGMYAFATEKLNDNITGETYELNYVDPKFYSKMISPSTLKLAEDVLKLLKTKLFFNDVKDVKFSGEVAKQILMSNNIDLFNFDAKDARYIFAEAIKDTFRQNHDRNIIFNNFDIKCEKDSDLNYVLKVNIIAKLNPFQ